LRLSNGWKFRSSNASVRVPELQSHRRKSLACNKDVLAVPRCHVGMNSCSMSFSEGRESLREA
jgi:hypothetical protein